jgi:hypothetical protein
MGFQRVSSTLHFFLLQTLIFTIFCTILSGSASAQYRVKKNHGVSHKSENHVAPSSGPIGTMSNDSATPRFLPPCSTPNLNNVDTKEKDKKTCVCGSGSVIEKCCRQCDTGTRCDKSECRKACAKKYGCEKALKRYDCDEKSGGRNAAKQYAPQDGATCDQKSGQDYCPLQGTLKGGDTLERCLCGGPPKTNDIFIAKGVAQKCCEKCSNERSCRESEGHGNGNIAECTKKCMSDKGCKSPIDSYTCTKNNKNQYTMDGDEKYDKCYP